MDETFVAEKSANQLWRESGTSLPFSQWIEREKAKGSFLLNKSVADTLAGWRQDFGLDEKPISNANVNEDKTFIGLNTKIIYASLFVVAFAIGYRIYLKRK